MVLMMRCVVSLVIVLLERKKNKIKCTQELVVILLFYIQNKNYLPWSAPENEQVSRVSIFYMHSTTDANSMIQVFEFLWQQYIAFSTMIDYRAIIYSQHIISLVTNLDN